MYKKFRFFNKIIISFQNLVIKVPEDPAFSTGGRLIFKISLYSSRVGDCDPIADRNPKRPDFDQKFLIAIQSFWISIRNGLRSKDRSRL
jgi:hypothetical protein